MNKNNHSDQSSIFILGASGYIGRYLFKRFKEENFSVSGTYFNNQKAIKDENMIRFDLKTNTLNDLKLNSKNTKYLLFLASANVHPDECKKHWEESYFSNVIKTKEALNYCFENEIIPIYFSTDNVFDGLKGDYKEEDKTNPINCYGRIKYEIEQYIIASNKPYLILRMGKVFGTDINDGTFITGVLKDLRSGEPLNYATDQVFTPCYVEDLFFFVKKLIGVNYRGILHLASLKAINRYEAALKIKNYFNIINDQINPCKIDSLKLLDNRPKFIDLNIDQLKKLIVFEEKPIEYYLDKIR